MFITFEGPEGSGKSSVLDKICNQLEHDGFNVVKTREPGWNTISEQIRNIILDKANTNLDPRTEALLYAASRRQHLVEKIWPALKEGKIVLCDRYLDSSLAYQGHARGLGYENILSINNFATENTFPDLTILFDIQPELGLERISKNSNREVNRLDLEKLDFHKKVREGFLELAKKYPERFYIVDASQPFLDVCLEVYDLIKYKLKVNNK